MKIGVLGSGIVGQTLAAGFLKHGHQVMLGTRDPQKPDVQAWLKKTPCAQVGTFAQAAKVGELVALATLGRVAEDVLQLAGPENLAAKTIIDTTNPLADAPPVNGVLTFTTGPNESLAEKLQARVPRSHVVKAFNSVGSGQMVNPHYEQGTPTMFLCGDDAGARKTAYSKLFANSDGTLSTVEASPPPVRSNRYACSGASRFSAQPVESRLQVADSLILQTRKKYRSAAIHLCASIHLRARQCPGFQARSG